jgi:hypothetical protein
MGSSSSCPENNSEELNGRLMAAEATNKALSQEITELHNNEPVLITQLKRRIMNDYLQQKGKTRVFANEFSGLPKEINDIPHGGSRRTRRSRRSHRKSYKKRNSK